MIGPADLASVRTEIAGNRALATHRTLTTAAILVTVLLVAGCAPPPGAPEKAPQVSGGGAQDVQLVTGATVRETKCWVGSSGYLSCSGGLYGPFGWVSVRPAR